MTDSESESKSLFSKFKSAIRESPEVEIRKRARAKGSYFLDEDILLFYSGISFNIML